LRAQVVSNGERYIAWSIESWNVEDVCAAIDGVVPELKINTPVIREVHPEKLQAREGK
jgi:hypothetical protein